MASGLEAAIEAVVPNGGKVIQLKHSIGPHGHRAILLDSEGIGLRFTPIKNSRIRFHGSR